jgi:hypothetical protein
MRQEGIKIMKEKTKIFTKKLLSTGAILLCLLFLSAQAGVAAQFALGLKAGYRYLNDISLGEIYGDGYVYEPYIRYSLSYSLGVELSYEGGYKKSAPIGLFEEDSRLSVDGFQLSGIVGVPLLRIRQVNTYFRIGIAYYFYRQDIDSEFVRRRVDHKKWTSVIGAGMNIRLFRGLFLTAEVKSVPLRVRPFDINVDLGGLRILFGIGYQFWL